MIRTKQAILLLALAAPALGGCHSIFGKGLTVRPTQGPAQPGSDAGYAAAQVEAGRKALDEGQVSAAIAAFRNARLYPEQAAAASNGLAIAYAQLGRPDLAERYFREAVAIAPADRRYQANLQRFYRLNPVEVAMQASAAPLPAAAVAPASEARMRVVSQTGTPTTVTVARPEQRLVRLSAGEVRLGSAQSAATAPSAVTVQKAAPAGTRYPVRVGVNRREVFVGKAPVAPRPRPAAEVAASQAYPLRVELKR